MECRSVGKSGQDGSFTPQAIADFVEDMGKALIVDCRGFGPQTEFASYMEGYFWEQFYVGAWSSLIKSNVDLGAERVRFWEGYPSELEGTSGDYTKGSANIAAGYFAPQPRPALFNSGKAVLLVDDTTPNVNILAARFRAAYPLGRVVASGNPSSGDLRTVKLPHLRVQYRASEYVDASGRAGLRPDRCLTSAQAKDALAEAARLLEQVGPSGCATHKSTITTGNQSLSDPTGVPPLGERMLALAKFWGTIRYFHPYEPLNDRKWDDALAEFVPVFAAAETREAYERAVLLLMTRIDDTHVWWRGAKANPISYSYAIPAYLRSLGGKLVVVATLDPAIADKLKPGDVITTVDGVPVAQLYGKWTEIIPASTPQSKNDLASRMVVNGAKGTPIRLGIDRAGSAMTVDLKRSMPARAAGAPPPPTSPIWRKIDPRTGYIDLVRLPAEQADKALDELLDTDALILDMRGYPKGSAWTLSPRFAVPGREGAINALFSRPRYLGPSEPQQMMASFVQRLPKQEGKAYYSGRIIVLIDERAISQSEHSILMFAAAAPITTVGTPTTGANGDITRITIPGGISISFSGHDVRWPDGRRLQRVGVVPDIRVEPTPAGIAAGRDEVLERAIGEARHQ